MNWPQFQGGCHELSPSVPICHLLLALGWVDYRICSNRRQCLNSCKQNCKDSRKRCWAPFPPVRFSFTARLFPQSSGGQDAAVHAGYSVFRHCGSVFINPARAHCAANRKGKE